jgi:hypothetical protein
MFIASNRTGVIQFDLWAMGWVTEESGFDSRERIRDS